MKYDYTCRNKECKKHNVIFEVQQKMSDQKLTQCNECKKETLERLITKSQIVNFSGNGWFCKNGSY